MAICCRGSCLIQKQWTHKGILSAVFISNFLAVLFYLTYSLNKGKAPDKL